MSVTDDRYEITGHLGDDLFDGSALTQNDDLSLPVSLNGRAFLVDFDPALGFYHEFQRTSIPLLNSQQANSSGDQALIPPTIWRRSVESWTQGGGQKRYDRDASLPQRFYRSEGIDCWEPWRLSLLNATKRIVTFPEGNALMSKMGPGYIFTSVGVHAWWVSDLDGTALSVTLPVAPIDVTTDGQNLYTLGTDGVVLRWDAPGSSAIFATIPSLDTTRALLRFVKGFLIVGSGPKLYDITTGTPTLIYAHPLAGFTWGDAAEGLNTSYLIGGMGDRWNVWSMTIKTDATTFDPPKVAAPIPDGEIAYNLASYLGYVLLGTSTGWRFGTPDTTGSITFGRLVTTDSPVRCFEGQDRFVWFGQDATATATARLGRTDLSVFTESVTPAATNDLDSGAASGAVRAVVTWGTGAGGVGRRVFTVDGDGLYAEDTVLVDSGYLEQGAMAFGSTDFKQGLYAQAFIDPDAAGQVDVAISYDDGAYTTIGTTSGAGQASLGNMTALEDFHHAQLRYTLASDPASPTISPVLNRAELRVLPISGRATQWRLPLILHEREDFGGNPYDRDVKDDKTFLLDLVRSKEPFVYREGTDIYTLFAVDFTFLPRKVNASGDAFEGTFSIVCQEIG